jgi:hypothetical protein
VSTNKSSRERETLPLILKQIRRDLPGLAFVLLWGAYLVGIFFLLFNLLDWLQ